MISETSQLLSDSVEKIFSDHVTKDCIISAEKGEWPENLWNEVLNNGLNLVLVPENLGGVGGTWFDAGILFKAIGRYQAPIPLAENIVAGYLLGLGGITCPENSIITILEGELELNDNKISGISNRTPFGNHSTHGVAIINNNNKSKLALVPILDSSISDDKNIALESRNNIEFRDVEALNIVNIDFNSDFILKIGVSRLKVLFCGALNLPWPSWGQMLFLTPC